VTTAEAARIIQKPEAEARTRLQRMVEAGLVESGRTWHLSAAAYRRFGERAAYVRQRGFEPLQQEQMVQQYVKTHGSISRADAVELCRITPPQAYRLLQRLVKKGFLTPSRSRGRSVRYEAKAR